jgi:DTW domain-containing protein YfiP
MQIRPGTVVLCPSKQSTTIGQYISSSNSNIRRLIVLDATWNSIGSLKALPQLAKLPWVHLSNYQTEYWLLYFFY